MAKHSLIGSSSSSTAKHRKSGVDPKWKEDFPWLEVSDRDGGMFCHLCRKHSRRPKKITVGKATWIDLLCTTITRQSLVRHSQSECHVTATKMEAALVSSRKDGGIEKAYDRVVFAERRVFIGGLKCMYFLNKREIAHTTNFLPLIELCKSLGATYLEDMNIGGNAKYTSERFMQESIQALAEIISQDIIQSLQASPFFLYTLMKQRTCLSPSS